MGKADQVEKKLLLVDGEELEGCIGIDEYIIEDGVVDVPGLNRSIPVRNGVKVVPPVPATFKIRRNSKTLKILEDWYYKNEVHDVTMIRTDATGNEISRELWANTEVSKLSAPAYDAASPVPAQVLPTFLPDDIIPISAEA